MPHDALEVVKLRNNFYKDSYRKVILALLISLVAIVVLIIAIIFLEATEPTPKYFAATDSGRIIKLVPLNQPNLSDKAVLQWASEAVVSVYSYNFVNFRRAFQTSKQYFTKSGWTSFLKALSASKNLKAVQDQKLIVSAVLQGAPIVRSEGQLRGRYTWVVQMPVLVTYQSSTDQSTQTFLVTLRIKRISTLDNNYGIGISEFIVRQREG